MAAVTLSDILAARAVLSGITRVTDLIPSPLFQGDVFIKAENLQRTGSFKMRGAYTRMLQLTPEERARGVIAASAGNHAQGVALSAKMLGVKATIVMPAAAPLYKITSTRAYGADVILSGAVFDDAYAKAQSVMQETGAVFIHAYDDPLVIAGQGTIGLEILEALPDVGTVVVPVGGGGVIAGIAVAIKEQKPGVRIIGVEPENAASMRASMREGSRLTLATAATIADGIAVKTPGALTLELCQRYVDDIVTVSEDEIACAVLDLLERGKMVSEGAGAASVAALLSSTVSAVGKTVAVLTGGNIDVTMLSRIIDRGLRRAGRKANLTVEIPDRPGQLGPLLDAIGETGANLAHVTHERGHLELPLGQVLIEIELDTQDTEHIHRIVKLLRERHYKVSLCE